MAVLTPQERADRAMPEALLKKEVLRLAKTHGWLVQHLSHEPRHAYRLGGKGFPDLVLAKDGRDPIFAELKREMEEPDDEQNRWLDALGWFAHVWRPSDLRSGIIHRVLAR
jgi:hypothetical protein